MRTELICIGTELLTGKLNTNIGYIGDKLNAIGLDLSLASTVNDSKGELEDYFKTALKRSDIIIATGGLGPTFDDLTRECVSAALGRELVFQEEILEGIKKRFARKNITMPKNNERQAYLIKGASVLENRIGSAPGQLIEIENSKGKNKKNKKTIILLPGPPHEMQSMFESSVFQYLKQFETKIKKKCILHVFGLNESEVDEKIRPIIEAERKLDAGVVDFAILAHRLIIDIKISVSGADELLVDEMMHNIKNEFYEVLGKENIYAEDKKNLEGIISEYLVKTRKTLSVAESCTGGLVAHRITNIPGSSLYLKQGVVAYSNASKINMLGVNDETIKIYGAVSEQTALEMAEGMRNKAVTDYAVSITGIAGPTGGSLEKPVGLVYIGISGPEMKKVFKYNFHGSRIEVRERAANTAMDLIRRELLKIKK